MRKIIQSQEEAYPENHHNESTSTNTLDHPANPQTATPSNCSSNPIQSNQEITIPLSYILQAKNLINHLVKNILFNVSLTLAQIFIFYLLLAQSSSLKAHTEGVEVSNEYDGNNHHNPVSSNELLNETQSSSDPNISKNPSENVAKKKSRKGSAAIITSEAYKNNLLAEKTVTMKKKKIDNKKPGKMSAETIMAIKKERMENEKPEKENQVRKRKQASTSTNAKKIKIGKPLEVLNQDIYVEHDQEKVANDSSLSTSLNDNLALIPNDHYLSIPNSAIINTENAIFNGEPIEVCYVNEDVMRALNL